MPNYYFPLNKSEPKEQAKPKVTAVYTVSKVSAAVLSQQRLDFLYQFVYTILYSRVCLDAQVCRPFLLFDDTW